MGKLKDIHIKVSETDYERLTRLCLHKGDMTFILQQAVKKYLDVREVGQAREEEILRGHVDV